VICPVEKQEKPC